MQSLSPSAIRLPFISLEVAWEEGNTYPDCLLPLDGGLRDSWPRFLSATGVEGQECASPSLGRRQRDTRPVGTARTSGGAHLLPVDAGHELSGPARYITEWGPKAGCGLIQNLLLLLLPCQGCRVREDSQIWLLWPLDMGLPVRSLLDFPVSDFLAKKTRFSCGLIVRVLHVFCFIVFFLFVCFVLFLWLLPTGGGNFL